MRCPYLEEGWVRYCSLASCHSVVPYNGTSTSDRCDAPTFRDCSLAREHLRNDAPYQRCPYLNTALAERCAALPASRFIPLADDVLSICHSDAHLRCPQYVQAERNEPRRAQS